MRIEGTDRWRDAYFEITDVKFNGVNQGPQAAARFYVSDKIFFSRFRYGVIRPCGPQANVNPVADCKPLAVLIRASIAANGAIRLAWPAAAEGFVLEENDNLGVPAGWKAVTTAPTVEGNERVLTITPSGIRFFRLRQ